MDTQRHPHALAHVATIVPDIEAALEWYQDIFDWELLAEPRVVRGNEQYGGKRAVDLLGAFDEMKVAHLLTGNDIGVELFEFSSVRAPRDVENRRAGFFHICVVDPDIEELAQTIDENGGDHYSQIWRLYEEKEEYLLTYCTDPFGNVIEIFTHSHEQMLAADPTSE